MARPSVRKATLALKRGALGSTDQSETSHSQAWRSGRETIGTVQRADFTGWSVRWESTTVDRLPG
jgi:hypothetical protein